MDLTAASAANRDAPQKKLLEPQPARAFTSLLMNRVARASRYLLASLWLLAGAIAAVQCGLVGGGAFADTVQFVADLPSQGGEDEHCEVHCPTGTSVANATRDNAGDLPDLAPPASDIVPVADAIATPAERERPWPDFKSRPPQVLAHLATDRLLI